LCHKSGGAAFVLNGRFWSARPHPALRATLSRRERDSLLPPGEGLGMRACGFSGCDDAKQCPPYRLLVDRSASSIQWKYLWIKFSFRRVIMYGKSVILLALSQVIA
jgi:hypothetical protein